MPPMPKQCPHCLKRVWTNYELNNRHVEKCPKYTNQ